ncbi:MAG: transposase [Phycisphaerales bacterium]
MSKEKRRHHSPEQKLAVLREHLLERKPISELCERHGIAPSMFYDWQRKLFENGAAAFSATGKAASREHELEARVGQLEAKIARKDTVIAEISEDLVNLKKELGEP